MNILPIPPPVPGEMLLKLLWVADKALGNESAKGIYSTSMGLRYITWKGLFMALPFLLEVKHV